MHRYAWILLPALVSLLAGCGTQEPSVSSAPPTASLPAPTTPSSGAPAEVPGFIPDLDRMQDDLAALQAIADANGGIRAAGTPGYEASVDHVAARFRELGFIVETPDVAFTGFRELPGARLEIGARTFTGSDELRALIYSPGGDIRGPVAVLDESGCHSNHFDDVAPGSVVLTTMGGCFRRDQAINAQEAGAGALLIGYPDRGPGEIFRPTLIDPLAVEIPVISVTAEAVEVLRAASGGEAHVMVETEREPATLRNVIARFGEGPSVVMLGGHLDSVFDGPGINDNGSGVAALLQIARGIVEGGVPDGGAIRIGIWGGEELGTIGSRAYAEGLNDEIVAYLNLDMAGSPNGATLVYDEAQAAPGSERITEAYEAWFAERGEVTDRVDLGGSSDHFGFIVAGIPTGGLFAGATESGSAANPGSGTAGEPADACYHLACDDLDNVDLERVALFAEATLAVARALLDAD